MIISIITDCQDANASGRQIARAVSLFQAPAQVIGVPNDLAAAGNLIDIIDAIGNNPGVILANIAPRGGQAKKWYNGTPFGYFWYKNILVVASVDGLTLSLAKKLNVFKSINLVDIASTVDTLIEAELAQKNQREKIIETQFRSFEFLPRVAKYLWENKKITSKPVSSKDIPDAPQAVWWVDNFGNCKTTLLASDLKNPNSKKIKLKIGSLPLVKQLKSVDNQTAAIVIGSSGLAEKRFLEIVISRNSAAKHFRLKPGDKI